MKVSFSFVILFFIIGINSVIVTVHAVCNNILYDAMFTRVLVLHVYCYLSSSFTVCPTYRLGFCMFVWLITPSTACGACGDLGYSSIMLSIIVSTVLLNYLPDVFCALCTAACDVLIFWCQCHGVWCACSAILRLYDGHLLRFCSEEGDKSALCCHTEMP